VFPATGIPAWSGRSISVRRPSVAALPPVLAIPQELEEGGYLTLPDKAPHRTVMTGMAGATPNARSRPAQDELPASENWHSETPVPLWLRLSATGLTGWLTLKLEGCENSKVALAAWSRSFHRASIARGGAMGAEAREMRRTQNRP
jgi:hypothetical protein